ncbi:MAG: hypothetical protein LiPW15_482 [Parcubacteria group bacterium LiPW_15]|nr:MAG: hypothetical protein LiPW15_482 [Parcubacteria group bacterium LiPW_15]
MTENEDSLLSQQVAPELKTNRRKMKIAFIAIIFLALLALIGNGVYRYWLAINSAAQYEKDLAATMAAEREAKMADTYGGSTPAETLQLYIDALKKNDFELASKYFIEKNRDAQHKKIVAFGEKKLITYAGNLEILYKNILKGSGAYSDDKLEFVTDKPFFADFALYPNNIWKITEI